MTSLPEPSVSGKKANHMPEAHPPILVPSFCSCRPFLMPLSDRFLAP